MNNQLPNSNNQINSNYQTPITKLSKFGKLVIGHWLLFGVWCLVIGVSALLAQEDNKLVALSKQIIEAKTNEDLYAPFEELKDLYFSRPAIKSEGGIPPEVGKDNRYNDFVEFLNSLSQKKKTLEPFTSYYIALSRYHQLKYLEEAQKWDEYFSQGNTYRDELTERANNTLTATTANEPLHIYTRLILYQFHKDQQDAFSEGALSDLMSSVLEYSKVASSTKPLKEVADRLLSYGEKGKSKELYKIYADKLATSDIKDDVLLATALGFFEEGNLELAESIYNIYIDRIAKSSPKEKIIPILIDIAKDFSYKDQGQNDPVYAEGIFKKIEETGGKKIFTQQLLYLRAFNLEKAKEYPKAKDVYIDLVLLFPKNRHIDEAVFKIGIINTYVLRDIKAGKTYFDKLAQKETLSAQIISGLYHLGLLNQWEEDLVKAKEYYDKLIEKAKESFIETVELAQERLKEIQEAKPIEYNLKTFLDVSLKQENSMFDMSKLDLRSHPYQANKDESVNISSTAYTSSSGCIQIELQYLWSGDLGSKKPSLDQAAFATTYLDIGTKVINLVVVSPTGIIDRSLDLVDVY